MKFGNAPGFRSPISNQHGLAGAGRLAGHIDRVRCYDYGVRHSQNTEEEVWLMVGSGHALIGW